ncbi:Asx homology domain-containing protein [Earliella scabrosa]|nr:Asx homology domain-containing protein [Earliella scabrosa]
MAEQGDGATRGPRRSTRTPAKASLRTPVNVAPPESPVQGKRKAKDNEKTPSEMLEHLLTNSKSKLTNIDISDLINYNNFLELSEEAQLHLCALLPPTAFSTYIPSVCSSHPDSQLAAPSGEQMDVDRTPATLDPAVFSSPFFLSAAHTWQDHLFSSWLTQKASDDLEKFSQGAQDGSLHADWKDEAWERDHATQPLPANVMRFAPMLDLTALAKHGLLQVDDVLVYRRVFQDLGVTVEKDILVDSISQSNAVSFLISPGAESALPPSLLVSGAREYDGKTLSMESISDPVALERGVLDVHSRVSSSDKFAHDAATCASPYTPSGAPSEELRNVIAVRAWKAFTVWRWPDEIREQVEMQLGHERGGRERVATLFYLRGIL